MEPHLLKKTALIFVATLVLMGSAFAGDDPVSVSDEASAKAAEGKTVSISGEAVIAKLAPAIDAGDLLVYCMNLSDWEAPTVTVSGVLELTEDYMAKAAADGTTTAGTDGPVWVIRTCSLVKQQ